MGTNKRIILLLLTLAGFFKASAQDAYSSQYQVQNYNPVSPSAFSFLQYTNMPVSEYTGIPDISIPLYQIEEDGVTVPVNLTYHAGGIRVSQEASWVGLGWDMNFGSIVQEVNDQDDYGTNVVRALPDWNFSPYPSLYPPETMQPTFGTVNPSWVYTAPPSAPLPTYAYWIYTAYPISVMAPGAVTFGNAIIAHYYSIPIDGSNTNGPLSTALVEPTNVAYDTEPDIYTANFMGHSIKFVLDFNTNQIVVLNKKGYTVSRNGNVYTIIVPSGETYYFEVCNTVSSSSYSALGSTPTKPSTKIWLLTKIITKDQKLIQFNYTATGTITNLTTLSQKFDYVLNSQEANLGTEPIGWLQGYYNVHTGLLSTYGQSTENGYYLNSITFPKGEIDFGISGRTDLQGAQKLDSISIKSSQSSQIIKSYRFQYNYTDATNSGTPLTQRLNLLSIQDNTGATHKFTYDSIPLPAKNSFAQDFWGFYNGQSTNTSFIPNPARLNSTQLSGITGLSDNGNNNSANPVFTQAGILTSIQYPTGGNTSFEYESNQFSNYWVPDFSSTSNTISSGNGLRIHAIDYQAVNGTNAKRTIYTYSGGEAMVPLQICRPLNVAVAQWSPSTSGELFYSLAEISGSGFFSPNSLGSGTGVGYGEVIKQEVDPNGISLGSTQSYYNNTPDAVGNNFGTVMNGSLPPIKNISPSVLPENGTTQKVQYYNSQNNLLKEVDNTYTTSLSTIYYGVRMFGYTSVFYDAGTSPMSMHSLPQTLAGYYPIYDIESLPSGAITTDYDTYGNSLINTASYNYDLNDQLTNEQRKTSLGESYNYDYTYPIVSSALWNSHRYNEVTDYLEQKTNGSSSTNIYKYDKLYNTLGTLAGDVVESQVTLDGDPGNGSSSNPIPEIVTYNRYDPSNANLLEYTSKDLTNSLLWDYNGEYVTAEITNANNPNIAATSFEADGKGNWTFSGIPQLDASAPTGIKSYGLSTGAITAIGLASNSYIVSYWSKNGPQTVSGSTAVVTGRTLNGYTYYEHTVANLTSGTISVSGTGIIDELRLYPKDAQMVTYTVDPLIGIKSKCDANNHITYYEYDNANRLTLVRDQDKNIIKKYCYDYSGQTQSCNFYYNAAQSKNFIPANNACAYGYVVSYTVPAGMYNGPTQANADSLAANDIATNGQTYANANAPNGCTALPTVTITMFNSYSGAGYYYGFNLSLTNQADGHIYSFSAIPSATQPQQVQVLPGIYNITLQQIGGTTGTSYHWSFNQYGGQNTGTAINTMTGVTVGSGSSLHISN